VTGRATRRSFAALAVVACCLGSGPAAHARRESPGDSFITVQTEPALAKIRLELGGRRFTTNADGRARIRGTRNRADVERRLRVLTSPLRPGVRARFSGWHRGRVTVAVDYYVEPRYVDVAGNPVNPQRIHSAELKNAYGLPEHIDGPTFGWLQGRGVRGWGTNLEHRLIAHSVQRVIVDQSNVVNRGQQRFEPALDRKPRIQLLFYSARVRVRDAIFGFPVGSGVEVAFPNGRRQEFDLGDGAELNLRALPRGLYKVDAKGPGLSFEQPLSLSRDGSIELQVITYLDIMVLLLVIGAAALGLLLIGRPVLARRLSGAAPRAVRRPRIGSRS
jgi:hypothetical protein